MDKKCVYYVFWFRCSKFVVESLFLYFFFLFCTLLFLFFIWPFAHGFSSLNRFQVGIFGPIATSSVHEKLSEQNEAYKKKTTWNSLMKFWTHGTYAHTFTRVQVFWLAGWLAIFGHPSSHSSANSLLLSFLAIFLLARSQFQERAILYSILFYLVVFPSQHVICVTIQTIRLFKPDE